MQKQHEKVKFILGQELKFNKEASKRGAKTVEGRVIFLTDKLILLQGNNYKECFLRSDFDNGILSVEEKI